MQQTSLQCVASSGSGGGGLVAEWRKDDVVSGGLLGGLFGERGSGGD